MFYGKNFHFYRDYKDLKMHLQLYDKLIDIPRDFEELLSSLYDLVSAEKLRLRALERIEKIEK